MKVDSEFTRALNRGMNSKMALLVLVVVAGLLAGCARNYNITTTSGRVIGSKGKPHYDKENGVFKYTDGLGEARSIPAGSVMQIAPASDHSNPTEFKSSGNEFKSSGK
jgi:hypothetical protein